MIIRNILKLFTKKNRKKKQDSGHRQAGKSIEYYTYTHYLITLHGISGNSDSFGPLSTALNNLSRHQGKNIRFVTIPFSYETGNDNKSVYDFADDFAKFMELTILRMHLTLSEKDKISFVMFSQGGLIGQLFLYNLLILQKYPDLTHIKNYLDSVVTLATPYGGTKSAQLASEVRKQWDRFNRDFIFKMGKLELRELSFASDTVYRFREAFTSLSQTGELKKLQKKIRFLNIVALTDRLRVMGQLKPLVANSVVESESDVAVPAYSANCNFIRFDAFKKNYAEYDLMVFEKGSNIDLAPTYYVDALHYTYLPNSKAFPGISQIPERFANTTDIEDIEGFYKEHGSFALLSQQFLSEEVNPIREFQPKTFFLEITIKTPTGIKLLAKDVLMQVLDHEGMPYAIAPEYKGPFLTSANLLIYNYGFRRSLLYEEQIRLFCSCCLKEGSINDITISLSARGMKNRLIKIPVVAGKSHVIDTNFIVIKD